MEHIEQATAAPGEVRDLPPRHGRCLKCGVLTRRVYAVGFVNGERRVFMKCKACR